MLREKIYFNDLIYRLDSLIVYKGITKDVVLQNLYRLAQSVVSSNSDLNLLTIHYYTFVKSLTDAAETNGFSGNVFEKYIVSLFLKDVNTFTLLCEKTDKVTAASLYQQALSDMKNMKFLMELDIRNICENLGHGENLWDYRPIFESDFAIMEQIHYVKAQDKILELLIWNYNKMGCGDLYSGKACRFTKEDGLTLIPKIREVSFNDIVGYKAQKSKLIANIKDFLKGRKAGSCLLYGEEETGKYNIPAALVDEFSENGLRVVELPKAELPSVYNLMEALGKRGFHFVVCIDELSENDFELYYDYLKPLIEMGIDKRPDNVIACVTSSSSAFAGKFDIALKFADPTEKEYLEMVVTLAKNKNISIQQDFLKEQALNWKSEEKMSEMKARRFIENIVWELENN